jgi:hypothetical protein
MNNAAVMGSLCLAAASLAGCAETSQGQRAVVPQANARAAAAGDQANRIIVGDQTQDENKRDARRPRNSAGETVGDQERGATSMQSAVGAPPEPADTNPGGVEGTVRDVTRATDQPGSYRPFALEYNPVGLFVGGRVTVTAEWAPVTHHVIALSPYFVHTSADVSTSGSTTTSQTVTGAGGELGYRYYTGHRGMNGVFVGPSLILGAYNAGLPDGNQAFTNVGLAGDVGVKGILWDHLVVGGGLGIEYLSVSHDFHDLPTGPATVASSGIKPRMIIEAGYGF